MAGMRVHRLVKPRISAIFGIGSAQLRTFNRPVGLGDILEPAVPSRIELMERSETTIPARL
jgi:hypothetical protein